MARPSSVQGLSQMLRDAEVLLIVPPFHSLNFPSLAVHLLQACGHAAGFRVQVLYANLLLASMLGEEPYAKICDAPGGSFIGERFFSRSAFALPPLGRRARRMFDADWVVGPKKDWEIKPDFDRFDCKEPITLKELQRLETYAESYPDDIAEIVTERRYPIVGCTAIFEQTTASVAILNRIKRLRKETVTILGGSNCDGEMAQGIASLSPRIDYIFSGESEATFPEFVLAVLAGSPPKRRLIHGAPCKDLDALPTPTFAEFYEQRKRLCPARRVSAGQTRILYETSRGCWWGQKHHCTFCGLNEKSAAFRKKSPERVISDLRSLLEANPRSNVVMADNIMPYTYFRTLLPRLASELPGLSVFYEQKANLSLAQVLLLREAGIQSVECGIESLSTHLLTLMNKGIKARQNLMLLRHARAAKLNLCWNLLWGFPGDHTEAYEQMLALFPLLHHLQPPDAMLHLNIHRFSPYYIRPAEFGVRKLKALRGYYDFLPRGADVERIAYHFTADYRSGSHQGMHIIYQLWQEMARWQAAWDAKDGAPNEDLRVFRRRGTFQLADTRNLWRRRKMYPLDQAKASSLLRPRPYTGSAIEEWAIREKLAVVMDDWYVPLPVADPELLIELEASGPSLELLRPQPKIGGERTRESKKLVPLMPCVHEAEGSQAGLNAGI